MKTLLAWSLLLWCSAIAAEAGPDTPDEFRQRIFQAQQDGDDGGVIRLARELGRLLGEHAGEPETPDVYLPAPAEVPPLRPDEIQRGFRPYLEQLPAHKWWRPGLDPATTAHLPREAADVLCGLLAAYRAELEDAEECLKQAREIGDYLLWTQAQAGTGLIPFPATEQGRGAAFEAARQFVRKARTLGNEPRILRNGWIIEDLEDGGLQFDNAECGVALLELHAATRDDKYLVAAKAAADWAMTRPVVPNWNYNSFSVYLLATASRITRDEKYTDAAKRKARLGVYPGQLTEGKHRGRWVDPHNARPAYHYILARSLAALALSLRTDDPERARALHGLRLALRARNGEIIARGIMTREKAMETLLLAGRLPLREIQDCLVNEARDILARALIADFRAGKLPAPKTWGGYLEYCWGLVSI